MSKITRSTVRYLGLYTFLALVFATPGLVIAQDQIVADDAAIATTAADANADQSVLIVEPAPLLDSTELQGLVGPIALYPDALLAIVLPASTYPLQIVQAARFLDQLESDSSLTPDENWDESIVALLNYPEVVQMMNDDLDWTWELGEAVIGQENDVINAISAFRDLAYEAGNLETDEYQSVEREDEIIVIRQVDEKIIYVPYYQPAEVIVYQPRRVYRYYPRPYPVYYYPYSYGFSFSSGFFWGVTTAFTIGWHDYHLHVYHPSYRRHPYFGYRYDRRHYYRRPSINVFNNYYVANNYRAPRDRVRDGSYWRPQYNSGSRPRNISVSRYNNSRGIRSDRQGNRRLVNNFGARSERQIGARGSNISRRLNEDSQARRSRRAGANPGSGQWQNASTGARADLESALGARGTERTPRANRNTTGRETNREQRGRNRDTAGSPLIGIRTATSNRTGASRRINSTSANDDRRTTRTEGQARNGVAANNSRASTNRQRNSIITTNRRQSTGARAPRSDRSGDTARRIRNGLSASSVRTAPSRQSNSAISSNRSRAPAVQSSRSNRSSSGVLSRSRNNTERSVRVAPSQSRSQAPTRQRSAPPTRQRSAPPSRSSSRSALSAPSRSNRPSSGSRSTRAPSRSQGVTARGYRGVRAGRLQ